MRTSIVGATFLLTAAGAALAGAPALNGSDTLFDVTNDVITSCGTKFNGDNIEEPGFAAFSSFAITYAGGGSGVGAAQMDSNVQHISPMSRTLKTSEFCSTSGAGTAVQATTEALEVGLDGIAVVSNATNTCSTSDAAANAIAVQGDSVTVNGTPYVFASSLDVLRLVYFGIDHNNVADCNSATRRAVVANWGSIFHTPCPAGNTACTGGLHHAFRRSDLSGTTDAFVTLVGVGTTGRGIGNNPFATGAQLSKKTNPFCNSYDANTSTAGGPAYPVCNATTFCPQNFGCDATNHCTLSNNAAPPQACSATVACPAGFSCNTTLGLCANSDGGMSDFADWDPIRIQCGIPTPTAGLPAGFDAVCSVDRTLGLVLPVFLPDSNGVTVTDDFAPIDCDPGACDLVAPARVAQIPVGYLCPDGQPTTLNRCWAPFHADTSVPGGENFHCRSDRRLNHCFGLPGTATTAEGRVYNKAIMKPDTVHNLPGANVLDLNNRLMSQSFFRLRQGLNANAGVDNAKCNTENDDTSQIGCITTSDPCDIGYAGREAAPSGSAKAMALDGVGGGISTALFPTDTNIINLVNGSAASSIYPLARRLYFATIYGFGSGLSAGESELAKCYGDNFVTKAAITNRHFVNNPAGVKCLDYDESSSSGAIDDAAGRIPGGCSGTTTNVNACTTAATAPVIGPTATEVYNIITHNPTPCTNCHSGATPSGGLDMSTQALFLANTVGVTSGECSGKQYVAPGNHAASYIIDKLMGHAQDAGCFSGSQMPLGGAALTPFQISQISQWIDDGAPNN